MKRRLITRLPYLSLILVWLVLAVVNYRPGTYLMGWDNVMAELNPTLALQRTFEGVWQQYQGLGLLGGMAHIADLSRQLVLYLLALFLPTHVIRWIWVTGMLLLGPLGVMVLLGKFGRHGGLSKQAALAGGLFYLLNLGTLQNFFVPYEAFVTFYGFLPWLLYAMLGYLQSGGWRKLTTFAVWFFLASSAFYVQTFFVVFAIVMGIMMIWGGLQKGVLGWRRGLALGVTAILFSLYWLLPAIYFTLTSVDTVIEARSNLLSTPDIALMNRAWSGFANVALLKGYWFDYVDSDPVKGYHLLLEDWTDWVAMPMVIVIGWATFGLAMLGAIWLVGKRDRLGWLLVSLLMVGGFMLTSGFGKEKLFVDLADSIPLFGQVFRSTFTKWSVVLMLAMAWGVGSGVHHLSAFLGLKRNAWVFCGVFLVGLVVLMKPGFEGKLVHEYARLELPHEYEQLFRFMADKGQARIAMLPMHHLWGWNTHSWGYRGSGFIWYGISQPILDRAFDIWSSHNEAFYDQASLALYRGDLAAFENTLKKYQVRYLLLDKSVVLPQASEKKLLVADTEKLLESSPVMRVVAEFGFLRVYEYLESPPNFVYGANSYAQAGLAGSYLVEDDPYADMGTYVMTDLAVHYPFANLDERTNVLLSAEGEDAEMLGYVAAGQTRLIVPEITEFKWPGAIWMRRIDDGYELEIRVRIPEILRNSEVIFSGGDQIFRTTVESDEEAEFLFVDDISMKMSGIKGDFVQLGALMFEINDEVEIALAKTNTRTASETFTTLVGEARLILSMPKTPSEDYALDVGDEVRVRLKGIFNGNGNFVSSKTKADNCNVLKRGVVERRSLDPGYRYSAYDGATNCDSVLFETPSTVDSYLMRIVGTNLVGRSVHVYGHDIQTERTDFEYLLGEGEFDWLAAVYPSGTQGMVLSMETRSFGDVFAENEVTGIWRQPLPAAWLAKLSVEPATDQILSRGGINRIRMSDASISRYRLVIEREMGESGTGLIILSQGFDPGWRAVTNMGDHLTHMPVNGWENGWLLDTSVYKENESIEVDLIYWPQYLEWVGIGILIMGLGFLVYKLIKT